MKQATIIATKYELHGVGIKMSLSGREVEVFDVNKYYTSSYPCSKILVLPKIKWFSFLIPNRIYIIPTKYLKFKEK